MPPRGAGRALIGFGLLRLGGTTTGTAGVTLKSAGYGTVEGVSRIARAF